MDLKELFELIDVDKIANEIFDYTYDMDVRDYDTDDKTAKELAVEYYKETLMNGNFEKKKELFEDLLNLLDFDRNNNEELLELLKNMQIITTYYEKEEDLIPNNYLKDIDNYINDNVETNCDYTKDKSL